MYVGVIPPHIQAVTIVGRIPHVRGGDPLVCCCLALASGVFPMYVGVILYS